MDVVVKQLMTEFCERHGLTALSESERFETFATHCVLSDYTFEPFTADEFRVGGAADGGIDGYAVVLGDRLFKDPGALELALASGSEAKPTVVIVQSKTSPSLDRKFISDLRIRVENILRTDEVLHNAEDVEPLRECLRVLRKHLARLSSSGVRLAVCYASTSPKVNGEILAEAARASRHLSGTGIISDAVITCVGRDELSRQYERSLGASSAELMFAEYYEMPTDSGVTQARSGLVSARDLVDTLSDETGELNPALFSENIREFQPAATVNSEIRAALRNEAQRRRFAVLNNGVTLVARSVKGWPKTPVVMRGFQVVNGCQTCHVLAEERDLLDDVMVKVQIFECRDDDVVDEIVMATNRQTEISQNYFINRRNLLKRLDVYYRHRQSQGGVLHFGRKPAGRGNLVRNGVIDLNRQLGAYLAMFGRDAPTNARRDLGDNFDKLFVHATEPEFYTAAATLHRWHWLIETRRFPRQYLTLAYQAISVVGILFDARPSRGSEREKNRRLTHIEETIWDDGKWERLGLEVQSVLDDALKLRTGSELKNAAASKTFGETVNKVASQRPKR